MAPRKDYVLYKRKRKGGTYWYFYYYEDDKRIDKSTGKQKKYEAEEYIEEFLKTEKSVLKELTLKEYIEPFYLWDRCPHIRRLMDENKNITQYTAKTERARIDNHILPDPIARMVFNEIKRKDILDFRSRLVKTKGAATALKVMKVLKTVFNEAEFREEIDRNPTKGVGNIQYASTESGIFSREELLAFFPHDSLGPWRDIGEYTCFLMAATTGMRRGEILALHWYNVDLDKKELLINEAFKGNMDVIGKPKWEKVREIALADILVKKLKEFHELTTPDDNDFVFRYISGKYKGQPFGGTKWYKAFTSAMKTQKIDRVGRDLKPHSLRHSLQTLVGSSGGREEMLREYFGWSSEKVQKNYTHTKAEHLRPEADIIDDLFTNE